VHLFSGSSLIEIIICLFILSLLLLGLDAMQLTSLREAKAAYYFSVATQQLNAMNERLHVVAEGNYDEQLALWNRQNQQVLPQGRGTIEGDYPSVNLAIFWGNGNKMAQECNKNKIGQSGCLQMVLGK
jgi:hypothetical protein